MKTKRWVHVNVGKAYVPQNFCPFLERPLSLRLIRLFVCLSPGLSQQLTDKHGQSK